jgi:hypothetical protein
MFIKHILPTLLFCLFTFSQVAAPAFCQFSGKIHLLNSGCADDDSALLFVNDDGGADEDVMAPLVLDSFLAGGPEIELSVPGFKLPGTGAAWRRAGCLASLRLYLRYRVFRI